jgi:preprotein translocase subunit SecD
VTIPGIPSDAPTACTTNPNPSKTAACKQWDNLHCGVVAEGRAGNLPDAVEAVLRPTAGDSWALGCDRIGQNGYKYLLEPAAPPCTSSSTAETPCGALGTDVKSGSVVANPKTTGTAQTTIVTNDWVVDLDFHNSHFAQLTRLTQGGQKPIAITLDGIVQSAPVNQQEIDGPTEISTFTQKQASDLANVLKFGALPLSFGNTPQTQTISATLGRDSLNAGLLAGSIGLGLVIIYCFIYYRALGFVTIASLAVSGSLVYATVVILGKAIGYTLSLAGIAGFIVAIGITADSFVVFYERLKDEVREGRTARSGVEAGWVRARRTILSADAVSLLAAVILYVVSIGSVRGFAFTLGVSTALDLVTVFLFTKPLVTLLVKRPFFSNSRWSGLTAAAPDAPIRRRPVTARPLKPQGGEL